MKGSYRHLDIRERAVIEMQLELGTRPAVIARYLNRSRSTITRELDRNGWQRRSVLSRPGRKLPRCGAAMPFTCWPKPEPEPLSEALIIISRIFAHGGDLQAAARSLGIGKTTIYRKAADYAVRNGTEKPYSLLHRAPTNARMIFEPPALLIRTWGCDLDNYSPAVRRFRAAW